MLPGDVELRPQGVAVTPANATGSSSTDFTGAYDMLGHDEVDAVFTTTKG